MTNTTIFTTDYAEIMTTIDAINPKAYASSRNFLDGKVTGLSPYLTHGVINTRQVSDIVIDRYGFEKSYKLIFELAWRDYYSQTWWQKGDSIFLDLYNQQAPVVSDLVPDSVLSASTSIVAIDNAIKDLIDTGYMHNHARMWTASLVGNYARTRWQAPAAWMYYHLLDGDLASNSLSWQWIVGSGSSRKYLFNQENVNTYSRTVQHNTFVDKDYDQLVDIAVPEVFAKRSTIELLTNLPKTDTPKFVGDNLLIYSPWTLDPIWKKDFDGDRVLLLEPSHFARHPISQKRLDFILDLAKNIKDLQVWVADWSDAETIIKTKNTFAKPHQNTKHWVINNLDQVDSMIPLTDKTYKSFMSYWKKAEKGFLS
jgi:deoxyribodipyrimidine photo-lyase